MKGDGRSDDGPEAACGREFFGERGPSCLVPAFLPCSLSTGRGATDAVILEHALEATRQLRAGGFAGPCVFTRFNTADFAASGLAALHPLLVPDFTPTNLLYATNLTHAEALLLAAGWVP